MSWIDEPRLTRAPRPRFVHGQRREEDEMTEWSPELRDKIEANAFRRLLSHLDANKDVQNIDLMILADFCRNCLGDWVKEAAAKEGVELTKEQAREHVYGMPYGDWKEKYQTPATEEQLAAMNARKKK